MRYGQQDPGIWVGGVRPGRRRQLLYLGIAVLAIGLDLAVVTYRIEAGPPADPRVEDVMRSVARAERRQMALLYGEGSAEVMGWIAALDGPAGHGLLIALSAAVASALCWRAAYVSGPE